MQRPLITSKNLREKLVQPENESVSVSQQMHNNTGPTATTASVAVADIDEVKHDFEPQPLLQSAPVGIVKPQSVAVVDGSGNNDSEALIKSTPTDNASDSKSTKKDVKRTKRLEKKRLKQQEKQLKKLNKKLKKQKSDETIKNNNNKTNSSSKLNDGKRDTIQNDSTGKVASSDEAFQSNLKHRLPSNIPNDPNVPRAKSKSPSNVKFVFDTIENDSDGTSQNHNQSTELHSEKDIGIHDINANASSNGTIVEFKSNGDYDLLPLIQVEKSADDVLDSDFAAESTTHEKIDGNGNVIAVVRSHTASDSATTLPISCSSSDSIPFIDDSPNPRRATSIPIESHKNLYDGRYITLQPRNIGTQSMIYARKLEKPLPIAFKIPTKRDQFDKSAQILYQSLKESIDHHFERAVHLHNKLCQVCHEFLLVPDECYKCLTCGLVCHHTCTLPQVRKHQFDSSISLREKQLVQQLSLVYHFYSKRVSWLNSLKGFNFRLIQQMTLLSTFRYVKTPIQISFS